MQAGGFWSGRAVRVVEQRGDGGLRQHIAFSAELALHLGVSAGGGSQCLVTPLAGEHGLNPSLRAGAAESQRLFREQAHAVFVEQAPQQFLARRRQ